MFPELFGSPYVLPAIIVVVLLLLLLTLILIRRKRRVVVPGDVDRMAMGADPSGPVDRRGVTAPGPVDTAMPPVSSAVTASPQPPAPVQPIAQERPGPVADHPAEWSPSAMPQFDPLQATVLDILQGWGELTPEDTNRLDVFRPERVIAAVAAAEVPKELKNSEYAHTRLAQLRRYVASIERPEAAPIASHPQPLQPSPTQAVAPTSQPEIVQPLNAAAVQQAAEAVQAVAAPASAATLAASAAAVDAVAVDEPAVDTTPPAMVVPMAGAATQRVSAAEPTSVTEPTRAAEAPTAYATIQAEPPEASAPPEAIPSPLEPAPPRVGGGLSHGDFLASLRGTISTAGGVLALPAQDRAEMLAFLEPNELHKVFQATSDKQLKLAVIDTLESVGSPTALKIIHSCLDDPDPYVQLHALDAAERLLDAQ